jgi:sulfoxide reductase heme-binding subunit YedZ
VAVSRKQWVTWGLKPVIWWVALGPIVSIGIGLYKGTLEADPVRQMQQVTGLTTLVLLLSSLLITPLRQWTGLNNLIRVRRLLGLFAFFYAVVHLSLYVGLDQEFSASLILEDIRKHPWVLAGFTGFVLLVPLALTSTQGMIRRLGGVRWRRLHWLVYPATLAGGLHFLWLVKKDVREPWVYLAVFAVLMVLRIPRSRANAPGAVPAESGVGGSAGG